MLTVPGGELELVVKSSTFILQLTSEYQTFESFCDSCVYAAAVFLSGMMLGGGCGRELAHWIIHGRPEKDMYGYDIRYQVAHTDSTEVCPGADTATSRVTAWGQRPGMIVSVS